MSIVCIDKKLFIREEENGITVYEKQTNFFKFYENLYLKDLEKNGKTIENILNLLNNRKNLISRNINSKYPFSINWLIEDKCNLDCIYCFADNKMNLDNKKEDYIKTAKHILKLQPLTVGITGGEPTLNSNLKNVIEVLDGKCSITIDTNGTTSNLKNLIPFIKKANIMLRITIDSVDNEIINTLRPCKNKKIKNYDQIKKIKNNIILLKDEKIPLMIHTVITKLNIDYLEDIGKVLIDLGIKRWHLYAVNYSQKCKEFYDKIKVSKQEVSKCQEKLTRLFKENLKITFYIDQENFDANAVLMVDSKGRFFVDSITNGVIFLGSNQYCPTNEEMQEHLNYKRHCEGYLYEN